MKNPVRPFSNLTILVGAVIVFAVSAALQCAFAQETGQILGTVTDPSGAVVPNVIVTVTNLGTNAVRTVTTGSGGAFVVTGLRPATYEVVIQSPGFMTHTGRVEVTVASKVVVDTRLTLGSTTTSVEVSAELGGAQVNMQTPELSQIVNSAQVSQMPSLTRNPYDFVALAGNVSAGDSTNSGDSRGVSGGSSGNSQNATTRGVGFNINGQRSSGTEILLDGVENISIFSDGIGVYVPIDATQEFRVQTSNYEPQYGRASGGIVNVTTKSGTNAFHGSVWEFSRLSAYTSNTVLNAQQGQPKGKYTRNQFGFAVGGPVLKDKLFFFGSTEWARVRSSGVTLAAVPTPQFLALSAQNTQDFFTNYSGGKNFDFTRIYTAGQLGITGIPAATPAFGIAAYNAPVNTGGSVPQNTYNIVGRVDYSLSDRTSMFFRYADYQEKDLLGASFASPYSQYNVGAATNSRSYLLSASHVFNPFVASCMKLSFSRFNAPLTYDTSLQNVPTLIVSVNAQLPTTSAFIQLPGFYDFNPANGGLPFGGPQNAIQMNQDLNVQKGRHSMQFGAQLVYIQANNAYGAYAQASEQVGVNRTQGLQNLLSGDLFQFQAAVDPKGALPCVRNPYTGALAQTLSCSINLPAVPPGFARSNRFHDWAVYAQDSFRMAPRFTANYGVRYEYYGVQHNNNKNLDSNFYYGAGSNLFQSIRNGQVSTSPASPIGQLWNPQRGTISPRMGFALDIFGTGKTAIRGGYGISYERNFGNVTFNVIQNPPNYAVVVVNNTRITSSNAGPLAGASGDVALPPTSLRHVDQNIRTSQTQFWDAALEQQLAHNTVVSLQYAGARGLHLYDIKNINTQGGGNVFLGDPLKDASGNTGLTRLTNQYSNINTRGSGGDSYYEAMNIQFQSTNFHSSGLSLSVNYTYAHQIDDLSTTFSETNNAFGLGYTQPFNPGFDRGNGDLDIRHRLVVAYIYRTPFFANSHDWKAQMFGGWQVTGIYTVRTGTPFTYFDSTNNNSGYQIARYTPAAGVVPKRTFKSIPNGMTSDSNSYVIGNLPDAVSWANPAIPAPGLPEGISDWGPFPSTMVARNSFRGPGAWTFDASISKTIPIGEHINLEFRAEGFNLLNHHNLFIQQGLNDVANVGPGVPVPITASKGGIGNNNGANDERRFGQFALKLNF